MTTERGRERDLILAPNEFAFILDETKGNINVYVGPHKTSLANTDAPVVFDDETKRFERRQLDQAIQRLSIAPEGWYTVLKNPATDKSHPRTGALNNLPALDAGRKVNLPGPVSFALWPGQMARVIQGHHLRSNQYLLVRVYDEEGAKANWKNAVLRPRTDGEPDDSDKLTPDDLTMGKLHIIRGTQVSFYIPPTGVEVVADGTGAYVRDAVTLERLEYCILLGENGTKRYIQGPDVVFPQPTETFIARGSANKFRAIELNENTGLYLKVIAPYEENGIKYKVGDELFITGKDTMIYFPRPEHAIIKYGDQERHFGIAIPPGEARYVLDRRNGALSLKRGPVVLLPDPRHEVIARRVLSDKDVQLWFPGNHEALEYNRRLAGQAAAAAAASAAPVASAGAIMESMDLERHSGTNARSRALMKGRSALESFQSVSYSASDYVPSGLPSSPELAGGDNFNRGTSPSEPRTVTLNTKYDGAVAINVWTGYAVMVVSKTGTREVVVGPRTRLLEYDEVLQAMELSTGTPKTESSLYKTVYLRVSNNKISDAVQADTRDLVKVALQLSYRVNFEGEPNRWFEVENYIKFLCDHMRSMLRSEIKKHGIREFHQNATAIVRGLILGESEGGKRPGRLFEENGMRIYDVELLNVTIGDKTIADLLVTHQHQVVQQTLRMEEEARRLEIAQRAEEVKRQTAEAQETTARRALELAAERESQQAQNRLAQIVAELRANVVREQGAQETAARHFEISKIEQDRIQLETNRTLEVERAREEIRRQSLLSEAEALVKRAGAVTPDLIAALQAFGDKELAGKLAAAMGPMAILGGESVADVLVRLLKGLPVTANLNLTQTALPAGPHSGLE